MTDAIRQQIADLVPEPIFEQAARLQEAGAVLDIHNQAHNVEARIANEAGCFEKARISFRKQGVSSSCSCRRPIPICEHAIASLLEICETDPDLLHFLLCSEQTPGRSTQSPRDEPSRNATASRKSSAVQMLSFLAPGKKGQCHLELRLSDGEASLETRWQRLRVTVTLFRGERSYSAGNIKKMLDGSLAAGGMGLGDYPPQERQIIRFLSLNAELGDNSTYEMSAHVASDFLHCLIGFERFFVGRQHLHVHAEPVEPCLEAIPTPSGGATVNPRLRLADGRLLPEGALCVIVGRGGGWIGVEGHYWWLPGIVDPGWLRVFVHRQSTELGERELSELMAAGRAGDLRARVLPHGSAAQVGFRSPECVPVLTLHWTDAGVSAELAFDYDGLRLAGASPGPVGLGTDYIRRDSTAEQAARRRLADLGFERDPHRPDRYCLRARAYVWRLVRTQLADLAQHWHVFTTLEFQRRSQESREMVLTVRTVTESDSWFELQCDAGVSGSLFSWEEITAACRDGEEFLMAEGGGLVRFSREVRRVVELMLRRAREHDGGGRLRFDMPNAVPLATQLESYLVENNNHWTRLRDRLGTGRLATPDFLPPAMQEYLRDYQKEGVAWLSVLEDTGFHGILADEMGLGKTIQALAAIARRKCQRNATMPSLVVCPTSLIENWVMEAKRFAPELRTLAIRGLQRKHLIARIPDVDLAVTSYALLRRDVEHYRTLRLDYLILDEAQHIKNPDTANARTCKSLTANHRLVLTGTPLENSVREIWSLFDFLLPMLLGSVTDFRRQFDQAGSEEEAHHARRELAACIRPFILRRTKAEVCRQLPPKIEQVVYCHLSPVQQRMHQNLLAAGREVVRMAKERGWNTRRFELLSVIMRLRQLCCHPRMLPEDLRKVEAGKAFPSAKTDLLCEIVEEAIDGGHRILLFSQFTSFLRIFREWLEEQGIPYLYLDGSTQDRQARVDRFNQDADIPIFLLSLKAGGTGLNLTGADTVIHYDQWWNPMVEDQATDRTHRIGQERPVTVYKLVARHSIEERIRVLQERKRRIFSDVISGAPGRTGELTNEDFAYLFGAGRLGT